MPESVLLWPSGQHQGALGAPFSGQQESSIGGLSWSLAW